TIEDERKHEEGKLEFRDAEDLLVETKRAWWSASKEYLLPSSPPLTHRFTA
ncbi:hypothetical protein ALC53_10719, partial [Atta colombica]